MVLSVIVGTLMSQNFQFIKVNMNPTQLLPFLLTKLFVWHINKFTLHTKTKVNKTGKIYLFLKLGEIAVVQIKNKRFCHFFLYYI